MLRMNKKRKYLLPAFLVLFAISGQTQEIISGLQYKPVKSGKWLQPKSGALFMLPFLDDFSSRQNTPDPAKWIDAEVFINNSYPLYPPSYGVATFDAVDGNGDFYENAGPFQYEADHLTSVFIDLGSLSPADSLYFSFRYQPQGKGNAPETSDSLVLEFLVQWRADTIIDTNANPDDSTFVDKWQRMWSTTGMPVDSFYLNNGNRYFKQIMLPVLESKFFRPDFRFRFLNYASLSSNNIPSWQSNVDQYNIDLVYLNTGRTFSDTLFDDMCFVNEGSSLLKNYTSMPYRQFADDPNSEMKDSIQNLISNLGPSTLICWYRFLVRDMNGSVFYNYDGGSYNLEPFYTSGYQSYLPHFSPKFGDLVFPVSQNDSASFLIKHYINRNASQDLIYYNDTITYIQKFLNYYAYDDSIPELGYGLTPSGAQLAYGFHVNVSDTIKGVLIAFNKTLSESNLKNFYLGIYKNDGGKPGELLYRNEYARKAAINDTSLFSFYAFDSDKPIVLSGNSTYYIGIIQTTDDNLNIGFDINNDASSHIFFNVDGSWNKTEYNGALMIRPIIGPSYQYGNKNSELESAKLLVYPNPNSGLFTLQLPVNENISDFNLHVYSVSGQIVAEKPAETFNSLTGFTKGIYFIEIRSIKSDKVYRTKMLVYE